MVVGPFKRTRSHEAAPVYTADEGAVSDGSLQYVVEKSGNTNEVSYQEASGAPVESDSPLGYSVGAITIIFLNLSKMIGTGIYSTRKYISDIISINNAHQRCSLYHPQIHWFDWRVYVLLDIRFLHLPFFYGSLPRICSLFPQSVRIRSCIPRAGLPAPEILLPSHLRGSVCDPIIQQQ
jgi:hypothetical protein